MNKLEGIVLSRTAYGESTLIVDFYSLQNGRTQFSATISKKRNTSFYFTPLSLLRLDLYSSKKSKYSRVKEVSGLLPEQLSSRDSEIHAIRYFLAEFLKKTLGEEEEDPPLYLFLRTRIEDLYQTSSKGSFIIDFLTSISPYLGMDLSELREKEISLNEFGYSLSRSDWKALREPESCSKKEQLNALLNFYAQQFEGLQHLKSKEVLAEVFSA